MKKPKKPKRRNRHVIDFQTDPQFAERANRGEHLKRKATRTREKEAWREDIEEETD